MVSHEQQEAEEGSLLSSQIEKRTSDGRGGSCGQSRLLGKWGMVHGVVIAVIALGGLSLLQWQRHQSHLQLESEEAEDISFVYESLVWENGADRAAPAPPDSPDTDISPPSVAPRHHVTKTPPLKTPAESVVRVTDWGAVPDGKTDCTAAIQSALSACPAAAVKCTIDFDTPGNYLTGPIHVDRDQVTINIPPGSTLQFAANMSMYQHIPYPEFPDRPAYPSPPMGLHEAMMTVRNVSRFVLTGGGTIDANGEFHIWEHEPPVSSIYIIGSSDVSVLNLTVVQPAIITLHTQYCTGVRIADLKIIGTPGTREDGLLIDSTQNAVIERLRYEGYGIGLCFASGDAEEGREVNASTSNILVQDIELLHGDGMVFTSAMAGGYRNITLRNILLDGSAHRGSGKMMRGMRLKAKAKGTGGVAEDITFDGVVGKSLHHAFHIDMFLELPAEYKHKRIHDEHEQRGGHDGLLGSDTPVIRRLTFRNITVHVMESECGKFEVLPASPVQDVLFEHVHLFDAHKGWKCEGEKITGHAEDVSPPFPPGCGPTQ